MLQFPVGHLAQEEDDVGEIERRDVFGDYSVAHLIRQFRQKLFTVFHLYRWQLVSTLKKQSLSGSKTGSFCAEKTIEVCDL